jgi:uncharacterized protein (TIGR02270 family)
MPATLFRSRPVLEHIVAQHAEEAAFLWHLRDGATVAPHYARRHLARLDARVEAHIDGLRIAGEAGWRMASEQFGARDEAGEAFVAAILALESGEAARIRPMVELADATPQVRRGLVGAMAWCAPAVLAPTVRGWDRSTEPTERLLALSACSVHRAGPGPGHEARIEDRDARVRARALRLAGELGDTSRLGACLAHLDDDDAEAAFRAAWSAVLLGDRGAALRRLSATARAPGPWRATALETALRAAGPRDGAELLRTLGHGDARQAVMGLGHLGDPAAVPSLLTRLADPALARVAGEAFAMITGADLAFEDLDLAEAPPKSTAPATPGDWPAEEEMEAGGGRFSPLARPRARARLVGRRGGAHASRQAPSARPAGLCRGGGARLGGWLPAPAARGGAGAGAAQAV